MRPGFWTRPPGAGWSPPPTQATRDGQLWIVSTGGGPGSTFLAGELERSRTELGDPEKRRSYVEHGVRFEASDYRLLEAEWAAHPAAGPPGGPRFDAFAVAADTMPPPPAQFAHEDGNRWRSLDDVRLIGRAALEAGLWAQMARGLHS